MRSFFAARCEQVFFFFILYSAYSISSYTCTYDNLHTRFLSWKGSFSYMFHSAYFFKQKAIIFSLGTYHIIFGFKFTAKWHVHSDNRMLVHWRAPGHYNIHQFTYRHVLGWWKETGEPDRNPHRHRENMHRNFNIINITVQSRSEMDLDLILIFFNNFFTHYV